MERQSEPAIRIVVDLQRKVLEIIAVRLGEEAPLLPILHDVQAAFGCVDEAAQTTIADALNLSRAEVHGVVSFYHDFTSSADLRPALHLCRAEACQARGVERMVAAAEAAAGQRVELKTTYCLGLCSVGPAARVGDGLHARLDETGLVKLVQSL
ncbi:NAD(P)H-dependent oxidoreductase subunit E [Novosphingobium sp.]|uniref:NAD(P)H-dependent oxidoreductase subunit E n=1 Tax=Novosphingobium sp. TaxID=1874826 RepID=UPI002732B2A1|nr:NAD(P)H-dependent oxidoreductase subunit E [Novosphingobium sp.]MDP3908703.1 NAD(P)H-dependent oxidoreductase subunit E [Novosphingobium sp.]